MRISTKLLITGLFLFIAAQGAGAETKTISGTEAPATYTQKSDVISKAQKQNRSALIQEVTKLYREMVSSFKAKRIEHAEEISQQLELLLQDPVLPKKFAEKISRKQQTFLARVYEDQPDKFLELESDSLTDDEINDVQKEISQKKAPRSKMPDVTLPKPQPVSVTQSFEPITTEKDEIIQEVLPEAATLSRAEIKAQARQKKIEEKKRIQAEKLAAKEARRQKKITLKKERAKERAIEKALKRYNHPLDIPAESAVSEQSAKTLDTQELVQTTKAINTIAREAHGISVEKAQADDDRFSLLMDKAHKKRQQDIDNFIDDYRKKMKKSHDEIQKEFLARIEQLYRDALELHEDKSYRLSLDLFLEIEKLFPDYKLTRHYISNIEKRLEISGPTPTKYDEIVASSLDEFSKTQQKDISEENYETP